MADIASTRASVRAAFRDHRVEGVPSSGEYDPDKSEIRNALAEEMVDLIADVAASASAGRRAFGTIAERDAWTDRPVGAQAYVEATKLSYRWSGTAWAVFSDPTLEAAVRAEMAAELAEASNNNIRATLAPQYEVLGQLSTPEGFGTQGTPVSATALSGYTYVFANPATQDGFLSSVEGYGLSAGLLYIKVFNRVGNTFTQAGPDVVVDHPAGLFAAPMADLPTVAIKAGQYIGFYAPGRIGRTAMTSAGVYSSTAGGNVSTFEDDTVNAAIRVELRVTTVKPAVTEARVKRAEQDVRQALNAIGELMEASGYYSPALLFLNQEGAWYDFSDRSTLYQDALGSVPVVQTGDPIGYVADKSGWGYDFAVTSNDLRGAFVKGGRNGRSLARWSGTQYLKARKNSFTRGREKISIFAVVKYNGLGGNQAVIEHQGAGVTSNRILFGQPASTPATRGGVLARQTDGGVSVIGVGHLIPDQAYVIQEAQLDYTGGKLRFWANGLNGPEGVKSFASSAPLPNSDEFASYMPGNAALSRGLTGDICELIEIIGEVSDETRARIYRYLSRWGVPYEGPTTYDPTAPLPAIWLWFNDPRAIMISEGRFAVGGVTTGGSVMVGDYNGDTVSHAMLFERLQIDDHVNPALIKLPDGKVLACFTRHGVGAGEFYVSRTTTAGNLASWSAPANIKAQVSPDADNYRFSYPHLCQLSAEGDRLYMAFRAESLTDPTQEYWCYSTSDDGGITWAKGRKLWGPTRPYTTLRRNGANRIDFLFNDSHPGSQPNNNTYHCYIQDGLFYRTDGTLIGGPDALPLNLSTGPTKVYDAASEGLGRSWIWDIVPEPLTARPVACFATFPTYTDHRYHQARWDGARWVRHEVCAGGRMLIPTQPAYSGGVITDPEDINVVFCSRPVDGVFQIFRYVSPDDGVTWTGEQLTFGNEPCFRPFIPEGSRRLFYCAGRYATTYQEYNTTILSLAI